MRDLRRGKLPTRNERLLREAEARRTARLQREFLKAHGGQLFYIPRRAPVKDPLVRHLVTSQFKP